MSEHGSDAAGQAGYGAGGQGEMQTPPGYGAAQYGNPGMGSGHAQMQPPPGHGAAGAAPAGPGGWQTGGGPQPWPGAAQGPAYGAAHPYACGAAPGHAPGGYGPELGHGQGMGASMGGHHGVPGGSGFGQMMGEIAGGGTGLSSLGKLLDFDDGNFWKGALVGAAAVLLLTNDSVQRTLFRGAVRGRDAVQEGVDRVRGAEAKAPSEGGGEKAHE